MKIERRTLLAGSGAALAIAAAPGALAAKDPNPLAAFIAADGSAIKAVKVTMDDEGETHIAETDVAADNSPYPLFKQFLTHKASRVAIYAAPPGHKITVIPAAKQLIYVIAGSLTVKGKNDAGHECVAGSAILLEAGARHREHAGPDGYSAIKVALAD
jgi:hypothetical protein